MILFCDGANYDDVGALLFLLKLGIEIDFIVITPNGWSNAAPSLQIFTYITRWFGKDIPIIIGSFYALKDYDENKEIPDSFPQGKMFGRTIPDPFLFELGTSYSYISWLPPAELGDIIDYPNYMKRIMKLTENLDNIIILSTGALTDLALFTRELEKKGELRKIKHIYHIGGGVDIQGIILGVDRSHHSSYNNYLDPDAAQECLRRVGKCMYWISPTASASVQFSLREMEAVINENPTPDNIWFYLTARYRLLLSLDVPGSQLPDRLVIWDVIGVIIMNDLSLITDMRRQVLNTYTASSVTVHRNKCRRPSTCVTYAYDNQLAEMYIDNLNGYPTNVIYGINVEETTKMFYDILRSNEHVPICPLKRPLGCYEYEEVTEIPPLIPPYGP